MSIKLTMGDFDAQFDAFEAEITEAARGVSVKLFQSILHRTPQYYGGLAASWTYTFNAGNKQDRSDSVRPVHTKAESLWLTDYYKIRSKGDMQAISIAQAASAGREAGFQLGRKVYLTNGADHGEGPYAAEIEAADPSKLRSVNRPGHAVKRSLDALDREFSQGVPRTVMQTLRALRISEGVFGANSDS